MKCGFHMVTLLVVGGLLTSCLPSSSREKPASVPGLTGSLKDRLEGIWEPFSVLDRQADHEGWKSERTFSWGKAKLSPEAAIIDFGSNPPRMDILGIMSVALLAVAQPEPDHFRFTTRNLFGDGGQGESKPIDRIDIVLRSDGSLEFRGTIGSDLAISDPQDWRFFRTYGPGISQ